MKKISRRKSHEKKDKNLILPSKRFKNEEETSEDMAYISGRKNSNKYKTVKKSHKDKEEEEEKEDEIEENNNNKIIEEDKNLSKKNIAMTISNNINENSSNKKNQSNINVSNYLRRSICKIFREYKWRRNSNYKDRRITSSNIRVQFR